MDYIEYALNSYNRDIELAERMQKLGFNDYEEYADFLQNEKEEAELAQYEALQGI